MSDEKETIEDIVAEMRNGPCCWLTPAGIPQHSHDNELFYKFADRIEAAVKRERAFGAEDAQICGEIGEMIGREATCEKSSAVCNAAAMREALEEIIDTINEWRSNGEMMEHWQYSELFDIADTALSAPPRNCDIGSDE